MQSKIILWIIGISLIIVLCIIAVRAFRKRSSGSGSYEHGGDPDRVSDELTDDIDLAGEAGEHVDSGAEQLDSAIESSESALERIESIEGGCENIVESAGEIEGGVESSLTDNKRIGDLAKRNEELLAELRRRNRKKGSGSGG